MIKRDKYLNLLIENKNNGFPKVITGVRRCGKSYILGTIFKQYLLDNGVKEEDILIIQLDDAKNYKLRDPIILRDYVTDYIKDKKMVYVILDEIQRVYSIANPALTNGEHVLAKKDDKEVVSFVDTVLGLSSEKNVDLYVTGSNSKMLSSDIVTEFRDKATNIHLSPLSFEEFYEYQGGSKNEALYAYMQYGGMPLVVLNKNTSEKRNYLKGLFETTYMKDILDHNNLKRSESLDELCNILSELTGELINSEKIANTYRSVKHEDINKQTVEKYISYFEDAFILSQAKRFDVKGRNEIGAFRKYYFVDPGLRNARLNFAFIDEGQILETIVYNELKYNGYTVNVGTFDNIEKNNEGKSIRKTNEIDFYAVRDDREYYIQVSSDLSNETTRNKEIRPFMLLRDQITKVIVVNKPIDRCKDKNGFTIINVVDFLLDFIK